jgi:hypothetical protein
MNGSCLLNLVLIGAFILGSVKKLKQMITYIKNLISNEVH